MPNFLTAPAPPLVIRQQPPRPQTPEPLVLREAPPQPPVQVGRKIITISGKRIPPPPRKVIIERLAPLPAKPQPVIVERWLPYAEVKRRVIFQKPSEADPIVIKPKNVIIQWEAPQVSVKKEYKYLGVVRANPADYVERYGGMLKKSHELPQFVLDIQTPNGLVLAAEKKNEPIIHELEGDVEALNLINLENEGLGQYRSQLEKLGLNGRKNSGNLSRSVSAAYLGLNPGSRKSSFSTSNQFLASSNLNNNSTVFQSASFVTQKPASVTSEKTASIVSERPLPERPPSVKSPILKSPTYSGVFTGSRAVSVQAEPEPQVVPETPKYSTRSILKSSSTVLPQQTYSTSSRVKTPQTFTNQPTSTGTSLNKLPSFSSTDSISGIIEKIFRSIDKTNKGTITVEDAEKILLRLNSRLGRRYGEDDVKALFATLDINNDGQLDLEEFKRAFLNLTN